MMAQAFGYLGLDYPAVRTDDAGDAGGFAGTCPLCGFYRLAIAPSTSVLRCRRLSTGRERCGASRSPGFEAFVSARLHFHT